MGTIAVRPGEPRDDAAVIPLLYEASPGRYEFFAGALERTRPLLLAALQRAGNDTSRETVLVAEIDGQVVGAITAFPARERQRRRRRFLLLALRRRPPTQWFRVIRMSRAGLRRRQDIPARSVYIDGLATDPRFRRRGVAAALLAAVTEQARADGAPALSVHTRALNEPARNLYERAGFSVADGGGAELVPYALELL